MTRRRARFANADDACIRAHQRSVAAQAAVIDDDWNELIDRINFALVARVPAEDIARALGWSRAKLYRNLKRAE